MLRQASKVTLYDDVIAQLREVISDGSLRPGDKLPPERQLASQLGVSRATLREALKGLSLMGVIQIKQGEGTFIREDINARLISQPLRFLPPSESDLMLELLETRQAIEPMAAKLAAERAEEKDMCEMREALEEMKSHLSLTDTSRTSASDLAFHLTICKASKNSIIYQVERSIQKMLLNTMKTTIFIPSAVGTAMAYHERILAAILNHDSDEAFAATLEHLEKVSYNVRESTQQVSEPKTVSEH